MEVVDQPTLFPGACVLTSSGGPVVDTGMLTSNGERGYLSKQLCEDIARVLGFRSGPEYAALQARISELEHEVERLAEVEQELAALKGSVRMTLLRGGVKVDEETFKLRPVPGKKGVEL